MDQPRNFRIDGVELNWAKLEKPVQNAFNKAEYQYELQIATTDAAKAQMLRENHFNVKTELDKETKAPTGKFTVSLRRKAKKSDGSENGPVRVVDGQLTEVENKRNIGNGSIGNVIVFQYPYENMGRKGVGSSLTAVQITTLEEYTGSDSVGFDIVGEAPAPAAAVGADGEAAPMF